MLLFFVEGDSDIRTLETPIEAFLDGIGIEGLIIKFTKLSKNSDGEEISGGDPTSDIDVYPGNIEQSISDRIDREKEGIYIYPQEVVKIIQIVDIDGAYIDNQSIVERDTTSKKENRTYFEDRIETNDKFATERNLQRKRENLDFLSSKRTFKLKSRTVEYSIYFFSSNLEHFMYGEQNMESCRKVGAAADFSSKCMDDLEVFYNKMRFGEFLLKELTYDESWNYIKERGLRSLSRISNINHLFSDLENFGKRFMEDQEENSVED